MSKSINKESYFKRLRELAEVDKTKVKVNQISEGTLIDFQVAKNGVAYGIIKENHNYFIKKANNKNPKDVYDFSYIGGLENINEYKYKALSEALKNRNFLFNTIEEADGIKVNSSMTKLILEGKKKEKNEDATDDAIKKSAEKISDLDVATEKEKEEDNTEMQPEPVDDMPVDGEEGGEELPVDDLPVDDLPVDGEEGGEELPVDGEEGGEESDLDMDDIETDEIKKMIGKVTNKIRETEMTPVEVKSAINSFLASFKDKLPEVEVEDRKKMAEKIMKVIEKPEDDLEGVVDENMDDVEQCDECGSFVEYAVANGYDKDSLLECDDEEKASLINSYINAHNDGKNDGDKEVVELFMNETIKNTLVNEYGHDEYVNNLTSPEDSEIDGEAKMNAINELNWGSALKTGLKFGKKAGTAVADKAKQVGNAAYDKVKQAGTAVADKAKQVGGDIKADYNRNVQNKVAGQIEKIAAELRAKIEDLNNRTIAGGGEPLNMSSVISTIANQLRGKTGQANLSKYRVANEGDLMENEEEPQNDVGFAPVADTLGVNTPAVNKTTNGVDINVNPDRSVNISMNENMNELSTGLARKAGELALDKAETSINDPLTRQIKHSQKNKFSHYINPETIKYFRNMGVTVNGTPDGIILIVKTPSMIETVKILVTSNGYNVIQGDINVIDSSLQRKLNVGIKRAQQDLQEPTASNELEESEKKIRKYVHNRLLEITGKKKVTINESKKPEILKKLDEMILREYNKNIQKNKK